MLTVKFSVTVALEFWAMLTGVGVGLQALRMPLHVGVVMANDVLTPVFVLVFWTVNVRLPLVTPAASAGFDPAVTVTPYVGVVPMLAEPLPFTAGVVDDAASATVPVVPTQLTL
ncbi:MAG TPA: hypothetical protein VKH19_15840 [Gemmatimonadaceae bacterium]|nr:hypothetical protein [Gemmatimonadaceae bacterium]